MDPALKHRLIGAAVLSALAIIFLPMLIVDHDKNNNAGSVPLGVPNAPGGQFETRELPLVATSGVPDGGVVGMNASRPSPTATTTPAPAVDANGQPLPAGTSPTQEPSASSSGLVDVPSTAPAASTASTAQPVTSPLASTAATPATSPAATPPVAVPVAPAVPIPAASAGGRYVVSLGTYSSSANAQSLVASLKAAQLPAYAEAVTAAGKPGMRVRLGPFSQRGDAEAARLKAQQVRSDMPASVTALDAAPPAPPQPVNKPVAATPSAKPPVLPSSKPTIATVVPTKPATPVVAPASSATRGFAVQVSAYRSEDDALTLRNKLRAAGFTAFSEKIQAESGTMYRVRVGPEADRGAAEKLQGDLSSKMGLKGMVVAYP